MALLQYAALFEQGAKNPLQTAAGLQLAKPSRVGRGDVHGDVVREGVDLAQTGQIVVLGVLERGIGVLADADASNPGIVAAGYLRGQMVNAFVVEPHAIDERN